MVENRANFTKKLYEMYEDFIKNSIDLSDKLVNFVVYKQFK